MPNDMQQLYKLNNEFYLCFEAHALNVQVP
jgi:hypothetical protein